MPEIVFCLKLRYAKLFILVFDTIPGIKLQIVKLRYQQKFIVFHIIYFMKRIVNLKYVCVLHMCIAALGC